MTQRAARRHEKTKHSNSHCVKIYDAIMLGLPKRLIFPLWIAITYRFIVQAQTITRTDPLQKEFADERLKFLTPDRQKVLNKLDDVASLLSTKGDPGSGFPALKPERKLNIN